MSEETERYIADCDAMFEVGMRWLEAHPNASIGDARLVRAMERSVTSGGVCRASAVQIQIIINRLRIQTGRSLH